MTEYDKAALIAEAMKASKAVFLATEEAVADDLSRILKSLALALSEARPDLERVKREAGAAALREAASRSNKPETGAGYDVWAHCSDWMRAEADRIERGQ